MGGVKQEAHYSSQCEDFYTECGSAVSHVDSDVARLQRQGDQSHFGRKKDLNLLTFHLVSSRLPLSGF